MKKIIFLFIMISGVFIFTGCDKSYLDKNFEEINRNIDDPVSIPSDMLIGTVVRGMGNTLYSTFNGSECGETWVQHISMIQYAEPERYRPRVTTLDGVWNNFYAFASNTHQMYNLAFDEGNEVNQGIALVLKAYCFSVLTDIYGNIPFSEALAGASESNFTPIYDSQADVYNGIFDLLDQAIPLLSGSGTTNQNMDILYAGDAERWSKFAHSLKFRCLMRISSKVDVSSQLQALVNSGMLFSSNDEEAKVVYLSASPEANPIFETVVGGGRAEFKPAQTLIDYMQVTTTDPRLPVYAQEAANGGYVGKPSGFAALPLAGFGYDDVSPIGEKYLEPTAPGYFLSYSELLFLLAEAAHEKFISGGEVAAQAYYEAGITNSFEENGVAGSVGGYLVQPAVIYTIAAAKEKIATQNWIVLYCQGFEAWAEWRRTGYPELELAADAFESSIPSRFKYQSDEISLNSENYNAAIAEQGPDELTTPVWWMK